MRRREFLYLFGSAAAAGTHPALAQQPDRLKRVGILTSQTEGDAEANDRVTALREGLRKHGWIEGRNVVVDVRYAGSSAGGLTASAEDLIRLKPDVLIASATAALVALQKATNTIPIVFAQVTDPVGAGFVTSLARPGGNITGFTQHDFSIAIKWLELLKELAPRVKQVGILFDPNNPATLGYLSAIRQGAPAFNVGIMELPIRATGGNDEAIESSVDNLSRGSDGGLVILPGPGPSLLNRRNQIVRLAERYRLPAVYPFRYWVSAGGLAFYGVDNIELHRSAVSYVDRILKGEKPDELPVQNATKFELVINLKAARHLGIELPTTLLARADDVVGTE